LEVRLTYNYAEVTIRRAEHREVDIIKKIIEEAYEPIRKQLSRLPAALSEDLGKIARHIQMGDQYVALVGELVVGTMRVRMSGKNGIIARVAVLSKFRGRRIGSLLVEYAENLLTHMDASCIEVEIYGKVEDQLDFYIKKGYKEARRFERLDEEIVVMMKDLYEEETPEEEPL
jgi:GNAT superfamily N-acetyltransferase